MIDKYNEGRVGFASGELSWTRDKIMAQLVNREYHFDRSHVGRDALRGLVGDPAEVVGKSIGEGGWGRCGQIVFRRVAARNSFETAAAIVFHRDGGALILYTDEIANFPMKPNGGDIIVDVPERGLCRMFGGGRYDEAREAFLAGEVAWTEDEIVAQLVDGGYAFDPQHGHGDISGVVGSPTLVTGRSVSADGFCRCAPIAFRPLLHGERPRALIIRRETAARRDAPPVLLFYCDDFAKPPSWAVRQGWILGMPPRGLFRV